MTVVAGSLDIKANVTAIATGRTLILQGAGIGTVSGNIVNTGANAFNLLKQGSGTWILTGTNTYTGVTSINGGTLVVDGVLASGGGAVTVGGSGVLAGTGTIHRPVTINGSLVTGIGGAGSLVFSNTLTLAAGSSTTVSLNRTATPNCSQISSQRRDDLERHPQRDQCRRDLATR